MDLRDYLRIQTRRSFFRTAGLGLETAALAHLAAREGRSAPAHRTDPLAPKAPHFPGKAKNVIFMFMEGAPSQMDLFDPKPALANMSGKPLPESLVKQAKLAFIKPNAKVWASARPFHKHGESGAEISQRSAARE
mgnify:CR=1 FL=1